MAFPKAENTSKAGNGRRKSSGRSGLVTDPRRRCCYGGEAFLDALKAMITRMLFILHAAFAVWRVTLIYGDIYWCLAFIFVAMVIETGVVLGIRRGREWKWFSPCVLLYLVSIVPSIWFLEVAKLSVNQPVDGTDNSNNTTNESLGEAVSSQQWTWVLEQLMLILIIFGRWLLPKGEITRDQLSSLLLDYVAIASDIVDFVTIVGEDEKLETNRNFVYLVLSVWTWSLVQFTFVTTAVRDDEEDDEDDECRDDAQEKQKKGCLKRWLQNVQIVVETETWKIALLMFTQDGPFLIVRLIAAIKYNVLTNSSLFFLVKNLLVLLLQGYRLYAIHQEYREMKKKRKDEKSKQLMRALYRNAFTSGKLMKFLPIKISRVNFDMDYEDIKNYENLK